MGFFSEIRKLLFAKKSVMKSGYEKAKDHADEKIDELTEQSKEWREEAGEKLGEFKERGAEWKDQAEEKLDNLVDAFTSDEVNTSEPEQVKPTEDAPTLKTKDYETADNPESSAPKDKSFVDEVGEKTIEGVESLGRSTIDKSKELGDKLEDMAGDVGKKVIEGKDRLTEKAKDAAEYIDKKLDETMDKAEKLDAELNKNDQDGDGFADEPADISGSTLDGSDDFFEKAKRFSEGKPLSDEPQVSKQKTDADKPRYTTYGMEDADGDGNELVDDAIIDEQE